MAINIVIVSKNNFFALFLALGFVFGVFLYDTFGLLFVDELMAALLAAVVAMVWWHRGDCFLLRDLAFLGCYFLFQIGYSLYINSNVPRAIVMDAVIQLKPFVGFYAAMIISPKLTTNHRRRLSYLMLLSGAMLLIIALIDCEEEVFVHISRYATAATITAIVYLYCSSFSWADCVVFVLLLAVGFFSTRTKFYAFFLLAVSLLVAVKSGYRFNLSFISVVCCLVLLTVTLFVSWKKIELYFFEGLFRSKDMWARPALYIAAGMILIRYIPFGSGLASFATFASGAYYSSTYAEFKIDKIWGLSKDFPDYISDTYYPALAQFGFVGIVLFLFFWSRIVNWAKHFFVLGGRRQLKAMLIFTLCVIFFAIESTSDSTLTHNRGLYMMILLGIALADLRRSALTEGS